MIDSNGFRPNVGIILCNGEGRVFWGRRIGQNAWQFPQGGIKQHETAEEALYRELHEEVGLVPRDVQLIGATSGWLRYHLPRHLVRRHQRPVCVGQKQQWFLLRLRGAESAVRLDLSHSPEFDDWRWVDYWRPAWDVVFFKRHVYRKALHELAPLLFPDGSLDRDRPLEGGARRQHGSSGS